MKFHILITLVTMFSASISIAAEFYEIETAQKTIQGELLEEYEDRWFFENPDQSRGEYKLFFYLKKCKPYFELIEISKITKETLLKTDDSKYEQYMQDLGLRFQQHPVQKAITLTGHEGHHKHERMFGNFAWDIGIIKDGKQYQNQGNNNEDYFIFGKEVVFPFDGKVTIAVDGEIDNQPDLSLSSSLPENSGNYVIIQVAEKIFVSIVHFKEGTLKIKTGDQVKAGQSIGEVGNSGVSYLPHLHYTFYTYLKDQDRYISIP